MDPATTPLPHPLHWHATATDEALSHHGVRPEDGLSDEEAATRLARHGPNRPTPRAGRSALARFLAQLREPLVLVLIGSGIVTAALGEWIDSSVILGVVLVNAIIGYLQEGKAEAALEALARAIATEVTVVRGGRRRRMDAVASGAGRRGVAGRRRQGAGRPAPIRAPTAHHRGRADRRIGADRQAPPPLPHDTLLADRRNMAYAGTLGGRPARATAW
jgi:cation-transporting ATPase F